MYFWGHVKLTIMEEKAFCAIDFETMTPALTSACAIGIVVVSKGVIMEKYYTLIKPIADNYKIKNTQINGITEEMVSDAPTFEEIFPVLKKLIGAKTIVCHNSGTDINVLKDCMSYYSLSGINIDRFIDTFQIYKKGLDQCCKEMGIEINNHHDALCDAEACAKLYLSYNGHLYFGTSSFNKKTIREDISHKKYAHETLRMLDDSEISNKGTIFYHKKVVITGDLKEYPDKDTIGKKLQSYGAKMISNVSGNIDIIIIANKGAGPSKLEKLEKLIAEGKDIRIIHEEGLMHILSDIENENK